MFRRKLLNKVALFAIIIFIIYELGILTHIFEKNLAEFHYSNEFDFKLAVDRLAQNDKLVEGIDINNHSFTFSYDASETCARTQPIMVILVKTKYDNFEQREAIRLTWGKKDPLERLKTIFLIGKPEINKNSSDIGKKIQQEHETFNDIVQQNFLDTYYNNTLKAIMGLQWIHKYCQNAQYYLFIDDDYYLNPNIFIDYLKNNLNKEQANNLYAGYVFPHSSPMRYLFHKWYISLEEYPYDKFPPYVSAGCYVLSKKSAKKFYIASRLVPKFRFDDIYMGILARKLTIQPLHLARVYFDPPSYTLDLYTNQLLASHGFTPKSLKKTWLKTRNKNLF